MSLSLNNLGDYSDEVHLFPFRTEKLSSSAQMVLQLNVGEYVVANFKTNPLKGWFFFVFYFLKIRVWIKINIEKEDQTQKLWRELKKSDFCL